MEQGQECLGFIDGKKIGLDGRLVDMFGVKGKGKQDRTVLVLQAGFYPNFEN